MGPSEREREREREKERAPSVGQRNKTILKGALHGLTFLYSFLVVFFFYVLIGVDSLARLTGGTGEFIHLRQVKPLISIKKRGRSFSLSRWSFAFLHRSLHGALGFSSRSLGPQCSPEWTGVSKFRKAEAFWVLNLFTFVLWSF